MRMRQVFVVAFPVIAMLLLAAERAATVLLGTFPDRPEFWRMWLALHQLAGNFWVMVERFVAIPVFAEIAAIGVATLAVWQILSRTKPVAVRFVANHAALLSFVVMAVAGQNMMVASIFAPVPMLGGFHLPVAIEVNWLQLAVLAIGLCACGHCHFLYLNASRRREREKALALLARGL